MGGADEGALPVREVLCLAELGRGQVPWMPPGLARLRLVDNGHLLVASKRVEGGQPIVLCWRCGCWAEKAPQALAKQCRGRPPARGEGQWERFSLARFAAGRHLAAPRVRFEAPWRWTAADVHVLRPDDLEPLEQAMGAERGGFYAIPVAKRPREATVWMQPPPRRTDAEERERAAPALPDDLAGLLWRIAPRSAADTREAATPLFYSAARQAQDAERFRARRDEADVQSAQRIRARALGLPPGCPVPTDAELAAGWRPPPEFAVTPLRRTQPDEADLTSGTSSAEGKL